MSSHNSAATVIVDDAVARLTLNKPEQGNALDLEMTSALLEATHLLRTRTDVRAVLLSGQGARFCVGGSINAFVEAGAQLPALIRRITNELHESMIRLVRMQVPIVVAVQGAAAGAGLGLALIGDWIVCTQAAKFRSGYGAIGFPGDAGITFSLPRRVGLAQARRILLRNVSISAPEALQWGLVDEVVPEADLMGAAQRVASELAAGPSSSFGLLRHLLEVSSVNSFERQVHLEADAMVAAASTAEAREGIAAFIEKRRARFI